MAGPKFDIETKRVKAVVVEYEATVLFSYNYTAMASFYTEVETWFQTILKSAPLGLKNGFFVSYLGNLAVRHTLNWNCQLSNQTAVFKFKTVELSVNLFFFNHQRHFKTVMPGDFLGVPWLNFLFIRGTVFL